MNRAYITVLDDSGREAPIMEELKPRMRYTIVFNDIVGWWEVRTEPKYGEEFRKTYADGVKRVLDMGGISPEDVYAEDRED